MSTKKLYRSRTNRWVAGVAGGLGEYFGIDPTLIRLLWIVLLLPGGVPGLLPYIICWAVIPQEPVDLVQPTSHPVARLPEQPASPAGSPTANGDVVRDA